MSLKIDINMCRICMKCNDGISIYSDNGIIKKFQFCTQIEILKTDDLPKTICNKCVGRLEVAYDFRKQAEYSDKYLRQIITHHKGELKQSAQRKQSLYNEMVLEIYRTRIKVEHDAQIEQLTDFESEEVSIANIPPTVEEDINCQGTERLTDSAADKVKIEEIEEADIEKIQETKINLFTIAKVTSIRKTESNETCEITGNERWREEDIESLIGNTQIKVEQIPTNVKSANISETIEEGIQYKGSTYGADILAKIEETEKMQKAIFTISKVTSIRKIEDDQTDKFECIECGAHFTRKGSLKRHSLIHSGERPYKCNLCGRSFTQSNCLSSHLRRHTGEKPYTCEICGFPFRYQRSLKRHVFFKHENQKKAEVKIKVLKQNEQCRRQRKLLLARETPKEAVLRREKEAARTRRQRYRAKQATVQ